MAKWRLFSLTACMVLVGLTEVPAWAQSTPYRATGAYRPYSRPRLSPYLNLLGGVDPAVNYYLGVIPERQQRINASVFQSDIQDLQQRDEDRRLELEERYRPLPVPRVSIGFQDYERRFMNYGGYFQGSQPTFRQPAPPRPRR